MDGFSLDGSSLGGSSLGGSSLGGSSLDGSSLDGSSLDGSSLDGSSLDGFSLGGFSLDRACLGRGDRHTRCCSSLARESWKACRTTSRISSSISGRRSILTMCLRMFFTSSRVRLMICWARPTACCQLSVLRLFLISVRPMKGRTSCGTV
ncbi:MAG: hypothetical protein HN976_24210 [Lentisphaerae bacterium]|nr:hypothetical protein [Lentisphaerota bacterium]